MTLPKPSQKLKPELTSTSLPLENGGLLEYGGAPDPQELPQAVSGIGTQDEKVGAIWQVLHVLLSALVFPSLNYVAEQCHVWGLEGHPLIQGLLMALVEELLRHCESKLTK